MRLHSQRRNQIKLPHPQQLMGQLLTPMSQPISQEESKMNCVSKWFGYAKGQPVAGEKRGRRWAWPSARWQGRAVMMLTHSRQGGGSWSWLSNKKWPDKLY